jgi:hypothetical protein
VEIKQKAYEALNETLHSVNSKNDAAHGVYRDTCGQNDKALNDYVSAKTSAKEDNSDEMTKMSSLPGPSSPSPGMDNAKTSDEPDEPESPHP